MIRNAQNGIGNYFGPYSTSSLALRLGEKSAVLGRCRRLGFSCRYNTWVLLHRILAADFKQGKRRTTRSDADDDEHGVEEYIKEKKNGRYDEEEEAKRRRRRRRRLR